MTLCESRPCAAGWMEPDVCSCPGAVGTAGLCGGPLTGSATVNKPAPPHSAGENRFAGQLVFI